MAQRGWSFLGKILTALLILGMAVAALAVFQIVKHGVSARDKPTAAEAAIAGVLRHAAVPSAARALKNPTPLDGHVLAEARAHWADHCAACHGLDGRGNTEMGRGLYPKVPDMSDGERGLSDGELFYIIVNGVRLTGMPGWGDENPDETWHLVHFIRHLPRMTPAELESMRKEKESEDEFLSGK